MPGTIPPAARCRGMNQNAIELRKAAASARAFADNVGSLELRRSFREMARRWDAEADERELEDKRAATATSFGRVGDEATQRHLR